MFRSQPFPPTVGNPYQIILLWELHWFAEISGQQNAIHNCCSTHTQVIYCSFFHLSTPSHICSHDTYLHLNLFLFSAYLSSDGYLLSFEGIPTVIVGRFSLPVCCTILEYSCTAAALRASQIDCLILSLRFRVAVPITSHQQRPGQLGAVINNGICNLPEKSIPLFIMSFKISLVAQ